MAPAQLAFVATASGEDPDGPSSELEQQGAQTRGWQSPRYCTFPQEIVLQLHGPARITRIQLLSHEYKIATKLEIYVDAPGGGDGGGPGHPLPSRRLGYLSFDNNERSRFQARELKSVEIDVAASVIRLVIPGCHPNKMNVYHQVGVVAVSLLGEPLYPGPGGNRGTFLPLPAPGAPPPRGGRPPPGGGWGGPPPPSGGPDTDGVDAATATKLAELAARKAEALRVEDYDEAKRIKAQVAAYVALGRRIAELEARKHAAIQAEDYDAAKRLKAEAAALQRGGLPLMEAGAHRVPRPGPDDIFARVLPTGMRGLAAGAGAPPSGDGYDGGGDGDGGGAGRSDEGDNYGAMGSGGGGYGRTGGAAGGGNSGRGAPAPDVAPLLAYDERPAVATGHKAREAELESMAAAAAEGEGGGGGGGPQSWGGGDGAGAGGANEPEELSAVALKDAGTLLPVFGEHETRCLYSRSWALREGALQRVIKSIEGDPGAPGLESDDATVLDAAMRLTLHAVRDAVPTVFQCGLALLRAALGGPGKRLGAKHVAARVAEVLPALLERTADANGRTRDAAVDAVLSLADDAASGVSPASLAGPLLKPVKNPSAWKPALGRLAIAGELVSRHKLEPPTPGGLPLEATMRFVASALSSPNAQARAAAIKIAVEAHSLAGPRVDKYFGGVSAAVRELLEAALGGEHLALPVESAPPPPPPPPAIHRPRGASAKPTSAKPSRPPAAPPPKPPPPAKAAVKAPPAASESGSSAHGGPLSPAMKTLHEHAHKPGGASAVAATTAEGDVAAAASKLAKREAELGADHVDVASALCDLAVAHNDRGAAESARPLYERALRILESQSGPEGAIAQVLTDLAVLHIEAERVNLGRPMLERALVLQEKVLGREHEDVAAIRDVLLSLDSP